MWPFTKRELVAGKDCFCQFLEEEERTWKYHSKNLCHKEAPEECRRVKKYNAIPHLHGPIQEECGCKTSPSLATPKEGD